MKENLYITLVALVLSVLIVWVTLAQPIFTTQLSTEKKLEVEAENLKEHVYTIVEKFDDRIYTNTEMLDKTATYIYDEFQKYSDDVSYQTFEVEGFLDDPTRAYRNVIANFNGSKSCDDGLTVVGGHYDTFGGHAGANDNTSAVAGLLELVRLLKKHPPTCDVQVVAYTLEEPPFFRTPNMGSFQHAKYLHDHNIKVSKVIVLDMIGYFSDEKNSQSYPFPFMDIYYPKEANFISIVSNLSWKNIALTRETKGVFKESSNLPVYSMNAFSFIPGIDFSDHHNYWKFDYPAILVSDTAFYRSDNYHTPKDSPETLDYERLAKVVEGVFRMVD